MTEAQGPQPGRQVRLGRRLVLSRNVFLALVLALTIVGVASAAFGTRTIGAASGPELYARNCAQCHGERGGRVPAAPLNAPTFLARLGDAGIFRAIAEGKGTMPAWGKQRGGPLGDDEIRALVAYLLAPERAGPGREVYQQQCASCHGDQGGRIPAAPLNSRQFIDKRSDQDLAKAIAEGKGAMPAYGQAKGGALTEAQVAAVVTYVRALAGSTSPGAGPPASEATLVALIPAGGGEQAAKPTGPPDKAQETFKQNCAGCHGSLSLPKADAGQVEKTIAEGIAAKGMPAFGGRLSQADISALAQLVTTGKAAGGGATNPYAGVVRHPDGWLGKHFSVVKENGTQLCFRCHQPSFCVNCHTGGRVKP